MSNPPLFDKWVDPWRLRYYPPTSLRDEFHQFCRYYRRVDGVIGVCVGPTFLPKPGGRFR